MSTPAERAHQRLRELLADRIRTHQRPERESKRGRNYRDITETRRIKRLAERARRRRRAAKR